MMQLPDDIKNLYPLQNKQHRERVCEPMGSPNIGPIG